MKRALLAAAMAASIVFGQGIASRNVKPQPRGKPSGRPFAAKFTDVAREAGLTHPVIFGNDVRVQYLFETSQGGVAWIDYDKDGWLDAFFVSGTRLTEDPPEATNRLYRNNRDGTFTDVTEKAGLRRTGWGSGVTVGDYDADGDDDLFVTYFGDNALYRNNGDGTFTDVAAQCGLKQPKKVWNAGASFFDMDRDGDLDLFVSNYVDFDVERVPKPGENAFCTWKGIAVACGPRGLPQARMWLYRNDGGKFTDISERAGVAKARCYGMTAAAADLNDDGWPDVYVACDSSPSLLFLNQKNGTFTEEGVERGVALNEDGKEQAGMGLGIGDYNLDGVLDIFKTHFTDDTHALYRGLDGGMFEDMTLAAGLGVETRFVGWGAAMADLDNDGWPDLFAATGQVYPETEKVLAGYPYRSPRLLFRNLGNGRFEQLFEEAGPAFAAAHSSRGAALGDYDNDGDLDILIMNRNEPPSLLRNDLPAGANWIQVRAPVGTRVTAVYGGKRQAQEVLSQSSFYSANDRRLHFGLGAAAAVDLEIRLPGGATRRIMKAPVKTVVDVK
ncbi:MAG: CRTAC1 family protein [Bryobacteraceae bacterium]|nr:CRTAC1 family protein [Bryobacteraceae bacterium]